MTRVAALLLLWSCGGPGAPDLGEIALDLAQVPPDATCVQAAFTGATRTVTVRLDARPGAASSWLVSGIPTGEVVATADAFPAACEALSPGVARSWFALPQAVVVAPDSVASVTLTMFH